MENTATPSLTKIAIAVAFILSWITLWASTSDLPYQDTDIERYMNSAGTLEPPAIAKAGFPFTVFYYPPAPLGNDIPPDGSFFPFALNTMIYFLAAFYLIQALPKRWITKRLEQATIFFSFMICFLGLFYTILKFD